MPIVRCENREDWLAERNKSGGASEAPILFGQSPYKGATMLNLYTKKTNEPEVETERPEWMKWGHLLEDAIAREFSAESGFVVHDPGEYTIYRQDKTPFMHDTPDRMIDSDGVLQLKAPGAHFLKDWKEQTPMGVQIQLQQEIYCTGSSWGCVAALIGGQRFVWARFDRHDKLIETLIGLWREFFDLVEAGTPPEPVAADLGLLAKLYPEHTKGVTVEATQEMMRHVEEYDLWKTEETHAKQAKEAHQAKIQNFMKHAEAMTLEDGSAFTWKTHPVKKKQVEVAAHDERPFRRKAAPKK